MKLTFYSAYSFVVQAVGTSFHQLETAAAVIGEDGIVAATADNAAAVGLVFVAVLAGVVAVLALAVPSASVSSGSVWNPAVARHCSPRDCLPFGCVHQAQPALVSWASPLYCPVLVADWRCRNFSLIRRP